MSYHVVVKTSLPAGARMAILSPSELLDWLKESQFLSPAQADEFQPLMSTFPDSLSFAKALMARDWLTPYQVNQILTGKHERLVLGSYRLRERIGEGAMGQVFKAWSVRLERIVAVKTLHKVMVNSPKALDRFRREMETAARLRHPNIALVRDADEVEGRPFLVMEFIEGSNLSQRVKQKGALPIHEAVEYARQAALGLQHAYERDVVHRDIKPANLLVTTGKVNNEAPPQPVVKILDFGLACYESERENSNRLTQVGSLLGTVDYVAPEQARDATRADIRADIYSLGCTLFYMLTARPPFLGETVMEKLGPRLTGDPPYIRTLRPEVAPALEQVLLKMMARRPEDRYQTPMEAAEALQPFTSSGTVARNGGGVSDSTPPILMAQPVTAPAAGPVVMAMPVAPGTTGNVPMAQPILATPIAAVAPPEPPPATPDEPESEFFGMSSTGLDLSGTTLLGTPRAKPRKPIPIKLIVACAASFFAVLLCLTGCLLAYFYWDKPSEGSLRITKVKWSMADEEAIPGRPHHVLVWIERVKCKCAVKVTLKDLPDGVTSTTLTIPPNNDNGQVRFTASYGTGPLIKEVKVYAECDGQPINTEMPVKLIVKADPLSDKKNGK